MNKIAVNVSPCFNPSVTLKKSDIFIYEKGLTQA